MSAVQVNYSRPAQYIQPGRTTLYTATGSGQLTIYIGNDGDPQVLVYVEADGMVSDPIPGNIGAGPTTIPFNSYLLIYADNPDYVQHLAPSIVVQGAVTPPGASPAPTAGAAFIDMSTITQLLNFMVTFMFIAMFMNMMTQMMRTIGRVGGGGFA